MNENFGVFGHGAIHCLNKVSTGYLLDFPNNYTFPVPLS